MLVNLINNARDCELTKKYNHLNATSEDEHVRITVTDHGVVSQSIEIVFFDPFFTTKEAGEGTGLGLSLVFSIIEDLDGDIDIISRLIKSPGEEHLLSSHYLESQILRKLMKNSTCPNLV